MSCLYPITAFDTGLLNPSGKRKISFKPPRFPSQVHTWKSIVVPCGKCQGCLADRRKEWVNRMMCELFSVGLSSFITLTFNDDNCPPTLRKSDLQKFFKRLRQAPRDLGVSPFNLRYFACGEYGSRSHRPHYHAILFGVDMINDPSWRCYMSGFSNGRPRFSSSVLENIWPFGFNVVGDCNYNSVRYVSKYISKQFLSRSDDVVPPFTLKSVGLGRSLFLDARRHGRKWSYFLHDDFKDRFSSGFIVLPSINGFKRVGLPRVLDDYAERLAPLLYDSVKASRKAFLANFHDDRSPLVRASFMDYLNKQETMKGELDND